MKPQSKYLIVFNEEAIIADGYDVEEYKATVDEIFALRDCYKDEEGMYCGDWASIGGAGNALAHDVEGFKLRHVKKWIGYTIDNNTGEYKYGGDKIESILKYNPERKSEL